MRVLIAVALWGGGLGGCGPVILGRSEPIPLDPNRDTDGDGLPDLDEMSRFYTDPTRSDTDEDGLDDGAEVLEHGTDPLDEDSDDDLLVDGLEISYLTDPLDFDTDDDGVPDGWEALEFGTDPHSPDTDEDGLPDGEELFVIGTDARRADTDWDELLDGAELEAGTDPRDPDSDDDTLIDGLEIQTGADPLAFDTDAGGVGDYEEWLAGTDPRVPSDDDYDRVALFDDGELGVADPEVWARAPIATTTLAASGTYGLAVGQEVAFTHAVFLGRCPLITWSFEVSRTLSDLQWGGLTVELVGSHERLELAALDGTPKAGGFRSVSGVITSPEWRDDFVRLYFRGEGVHSESVVLDDVRLGCGTP